MMYNNGSVSKNVKYQDICTIETIIVNISYFTLPGFFEIVNNSMYEWHDFYPLINDMSSKSYDFEILKIFIQHLKAKVNWIDCNFTRGLFDDETGQWTGATGMVTIYSACRGSFFGIQRCF